MAEESNKDQVFYEDDYKIRGAPPAPPRPDGASVYSYWRFDGWSINGATLTSGSSFNPLNSFLHTLDLSAYPVWTWIDVQENESQDS